MPALDFWRIPFTPMAGTTLNYYGRFGGVLTTGGSGTLGGTSTVWGVKRHITPAGDNSLFLPASSGVVNCADHLYPLLRTDTLLNPGGVGGLLLILGVWQYATLSSGTHVILQYGDTGGNNGGYRVQFSGDRVRAFYRGDSSGSFITNGAGLGSINNTDIAYGCYFDMHNLEGHTWRDDLFQSSPSETVTLQGLGNHPGHTETVNFRVSLTCGMTTGPAAANQVNASASADISHGPLTVYRFPARPSDARLAQIATEHYRNPWQIPRSLIGAAA